MECQISPPGIPGDDQDHKMDHFDIDGWMRVVAPTDNPKSTKDSPSAAGTAAGPDPSSLAPLDRSPPPPLLDRSSPPLPLQKPKQLPTTTREDMLKVPPWLPPSAFTLAGGRQEMREGSRVRGRVEWGLGSWGSVSLAPPSDLIRYYDKGDEEARVDQSSHALLVSCSWEGSWEGSWVTTGSGSCEGSWLTKWRGC